MFSADLSQAFPLTVSDFFLLMDLILAVVFVLYFSIGKPRTWYKDPLGWVIFGYGVAVVALLGLICYAIVFGQKVDELFRSLVSVALGGALIMKTLSVHQERAKGRLAAESYPTSERRVTMTETPTVAEIKDATTIWYKGQRFWRSLVGALVVLIPVVNGSAAALSAYLQEQTDVVIPGEVFIWLNAVVAFTALIIGGVSRLMAVPGFNAWLTKWLNLGAVPKDAIAQYSGTGEVYVMPDEKAIERG